MLPGIQVLLTPDKCAELLVSTIEGLQQYRNAGASKCEQRGGVWLDLGVASLTAALWR